MAVIWCVEKGNLARFLAAAVIPGVGIQRMCEWSRRSAFILFHKNYKKMNRAYKVFLKNADIEHKCYCVHLYGLCDGGVCYEQS